MSQALKTAPAAGGEAPTAAPNGGKRRRALLVLLILAIVGGGSATACWLHARNYETTDDAFVDGHVAFISPKVAGQVVAVHVHDNQFVKAGEVLVTIDDRDCKARLAQAQGALKAAEAQAAAAAATLEVTKATAPADHDLAEAGVEAAKSAVAAAQTQVRMARSQQVQAEAAARSAQADVEQAKADAMATEADANRTNADMLRYRELIKTRSSTPQELDDAVATAKAAAAHLVAAKKKITAAEAQAQAGEAAAKTAAEGVTQAESAVEQARAALGEANAKLAQAAPFAQRVLYSKAQSQSADAQIAQLTAAAAAAQLQVDYCAVVAPCDGYVTRRTVEPGVYVQPGQPMLAVVSPEVWVTANYKETQLALMKPGQPVTVEVDSMSGREFKAHVDSIMAGSGARFSLLPPENATGNYVKVVQRVPVKIVFDEPVDASKVGPGLSVVPSVKVR